MTAAPIQYPRPVQQRLRWTGRSVLALDVLPATDRDKMPEAPHRSVFVSGEGADAGLGPYALRDIASPVDHPA